MARTTNKALLSVSPDVRATLPETLIEYIWELALSDDWKYCDRQSMILKAVALNGRNIQDIYHVCDYDNVTDKRRVYGVKPITCKIEIFNSHGRYQMQL